MKKGGSLYSSNFDPKKWDKKEVTQKGKLFIKERVFSLFHNPLNFESVIEKNLQKLKDAKAMQKDTIILFDKKSPFFNNVYINTKKAIPKVHDVKVTGTFLTKVFEGSTKDTKTWIKEMKKYVKLEKQKLKHMYFYYATYPEKENGKGKNYVVLFAEI